MGSLASVGAVMVGGYGQKPNEIPVAIRSATPGLGDSQRVDCVNSLRWLYADDFVPFQTLVAVELVPVQLPDFSQVIKAAVRCSFCSPKGVPEKLGCSSQGE